MFKNKKIVSLIAIALVACLGVAGIAAYFTDTDSATNTFTIGEIKLDLKEPNWDPEDVEDVIPNEEIAKDPQIENTGVNDEFLFMTVSVPYSTIITATEDGKLLNNGNAAATQLFSYDVNSGWIQLGEATWSEADADGNGTVTYIYAYAANDAMTAVEAGETTATLFDTVKFCNAIEGQGLENVSKDIVITAYGIQTENVNGGVTAPADVWTVVKNQTIDQAKAV
jgi:predicted ribosomally synthesized peptide with SipW-like signal peptide